jgi:GNAT superfamily N-acetyltransferase
VSCMTPPGSFVASADSVWMPWYTHRPGPDPVIGHGDVGPWNIIARDGMPVAFVDWDFTGPVERLDEVAVAIRLNCQLQGDDAAARRSLPSPQQRARQVAVFADAYGLTTDERAQVVDRVVEAAIRDCTNDADEAVVTAGFVGPHPMVWGMAWQAREGVGSSTTAVSSKKPWGCGHDRRCRHRLAVPGQRRGVGGSTESHGGRAVTGWWDRVRPHSLGWVTARVSDGSLVGFVNVAWDGCNHSFLIDTKTRPGYQRRGVAAAVVGLAVRQAKAAGCKWLHVDFVGELRPLYCDACGFQPAQAAGLINLYELEATP